MMEKKGVFLPLLLQMCSPHFCFSAIKRFAKDRVEPTARDRSEGYRSFLDSSILRDIICFGPPRDLRDQHANSNRLL